MALTLTACNNEIEETRGDGTPTDVTLTVSVPDDIVNFKSDENPGDGSYVNRCILEIYENGNLFGERLVSDVDNMSATFAVRLITGNTYDFVFWADCAEGNATDGFTDTYYDTESLYDIRLLDGAFANNQDRLDAFYGSFTQEIGNTNSMNFSLKRPFGQMNIYTLDLASVPSDIDLSRVQAKVSFSEVPAGLNAVEDRLSEDRTSLTPAEFVTPVNFPQAGETPAEEAQITFDYLFASPASNETLVSFKLELVQDGREICPDYNADNIPIRQNYRTNVKSNFIIDVMEVTVGLEPIFEDGDINIGGNEGSERLEIPQPRFIDTTATYITVAWEPVTNAAGYTYVINNGEEVYTTENTYTIETPEYGDYSFRVKAIPEDLSTEFEESEWSETIVYSYWTNYYLMNWLGEYSGASTHTLAMNADGSLSLYETPKNINISLAPSNDPETVLIYGLSALGANWPAYGAMLVDENQNPIGLAITAESQQVGTGGANGEYLLHWYCMYLDNYNSLSFVIGMSWSFALLNNGDNISTLASTGYFDDAGTHTFTTIATDIFALSGTSIVRFFDTAEFPAVQWNLEKTGSYNGTSSIQRVKEAYIPDVYAGSKYRVAVR